MKRKKELRTVEGKKIKPKLLFVAQTYTLSSTQKSKHKHTRIFSLSLSLSAVSVMCLLYSTFAPQFFLRFQQDAVRCSIVLKHRIFFFWENEKIMRLFFYFLCSPAKMTLQNAWKLFFLKFHFHSPCCVLRTELRIVVINVRQSWLIHLTPKTDTASWHKWSCGLGAC